MHAHSTKPLGDEYDDNSGGSWNEILHWDQETWERGLYEMNIF